MTEEDKKSAAEGLLLQQQQQQDQARKPFRFLNQAEFEALNEADKFAYVTAAYEELKRTNS